MTGRLADTTWTDLSGRHPVVLLPVGSCEQHGPHLPLDTDTAVATAVAERAVRRLAPDIDALLAPAQAYGASGEHSGFPGTVSIGLSALCLTLIEIGRSALSWARRLVLVNGHGGNLASVVDATVKLRAESRDVAWWACATPESDAHAGRSETSLMLALRPTAVHPDRAVAGPTEPVTELMGRLVAETVRGVSPSGVLGDPAGAHAGEGGARCTELSLKLADAVRGWRVDGRGRLLDRTHPTADAMTASLDPDPTRWIGP